MMFGVIRIQDEGIAEKFDKEVFRFLGGYEKTEFGGKFNNVIYLDSLFKKITDVLTEAVR